MALVFTDPNSAGPMPSFGMKDVQVKVIRLQAANFSTAGVNTLMAKFPADTSFLGFEYWVATALDNGATSPQLSLGSASAGTQFASLAAVTNTVGTNAKLSPVTGIQQAQNIPYSTDIEFWVRGVCATANPTNADVRLAIYFTR